MMTRLFQSELFCGIALCLVVAGLCFALWICFRIHKKRIRLVSETSELLAALKQLNGQFFFHTFPSAYQYCKSLKSKSQFDRAHLSDILDEWVFSHENEMARVTKLAIENRELFQEYVREYELTMQADASVHHAYHDQYSYFRRYEANEAKKSLLNPSRDVYVTIHKEYTSPKGRNHYHAKQTYTQTAVSHSLLKCKQMREKQDERQRERAKVTESVRYDILLRDGFRCCICGATAADGVELHVDHIQPIAKGGKSVPENLRTLCDRCNRGKSDKYNPDGLN